MTWKTLPKKAVGEHATTGLRAALDLQNGRWNNTEGSTLQRIKARIALRNAWQDEDYTKLKVHSMSRRWLVVLPNTN